MPADEDFMDHSLCSTCTHMISRILIPIDAEDFGLNDDDLENDAGEPVQVEQNTCMLLNMDIMYVVVECNKYKKENISLIQNSPWVLDK